MNVATIASWSPALSRSPVLAIAMRKAVLNRGVSVVVLPGDVALKPALKAPPRIGIMRRSR